MPIKRQYETKPLECWAKMKELRRWRFRNNWEARKKGEIVIMGEHMGMRPLWSGFGSDHYAVMSVSPYWTGTKRNLEELTKVLEYVDAKGYGPEVCGSLKIHLAHLLMGASIKSPMGEEVKPDFVWQLNFCPQVSRLGYIASKVLNIPYIYIEPLMGGDPEKSREYIVAQLYEALEKGKKIIGKAYDDEKLIQATKNDLQTLKLFSEICELNKAVPAPLNGRQLVSLNLIATVMSHTKESVEFYKELLDEVKYRIQNKISTCGFETKRILMDGFPWPYPYLLRYSEEYGAVVVCGDHPFLNAHLEEDENGHWVARKGIDELRNSIKTKDDALRALAWIWEGGIKVVRHSLHNFHVEETAEYPIKMAQQWHCDGMILLAMRDCFQQMNFATETKLLAEQRGIPNMQFFSILADIRRFDEAKLRQQFDEFFEKKLGLTKIPKETVEDEED
jgi:benzoyl-CoA reductase subunit B